MIAVRIIAIWGIVAIASAVAAALIASAKRRDHSAWAGWTFLFPPLLLLLIVIPRNRGQRPTRPSLDEEDRTMETP
jgi:hypothetical protein